ncbi:MAG: ankyrin repeat domain-containing protein [Patescibacteria group bacterium]|nr:ankyrin repeat domain-containing protein [Patescibacteria group bacterium]
MSTAETDEKNRGVCRALAVLTAKYAVAPEEAFMVRALNPSVRSPVQPTDEWNSVPFVVRNGWFREVSRLLPGDRMKKYNCCLAHSIVDYGGFRVLRWLFTAIPSYSVSQMVMVAIIKNKNTLNTLKWLYAICGHCFPYYIKYDMVQLALEHGNLPVLEWAHTHGWINEIGEYDRFASRTGRVDLMQWLDERGYKFKPRSFDDAARYGHLDAMEWLHSSGCVPDGTACYYATKFGVPKAIEWFRKKMGTCPCGGRYHP